MTDSAVEVYGELVTTERIGLVVGRILLGERMTTREIAAYLGMTPNGAWRMMDKLGRVLPIHQTDDVWQRGPIEWPY